MAKTFKTPSGEAAPTKSRKSVSSLGKRTQKRFSSMIGSLRNVDPSNLNLFELEDMALQTKYSLR